MMTLISAVHICELSDDLEEVYSFPGEYSLLLRDIFDILAHFRSTVNLYTILTE